MGSPIDGGLGCFEDLTTANCVAIKVCVGLWPDAFNSPEKLPTRETAGSGGTSSFRFC